MPRRSIETIWFRERPWRHWTSRLAGWALILAFLVASTTGCERRPPPVTDPAKAPWLLDPNSQIEGLKSGDFRIRGLSAFNLGNMGAKASEAIPILEKLAKEDPHPKVREEARMAVDKIRSAADKTN